MNEVQGLMCGALQAVIQKLSDEAVLPFCDNLMTLFLQVLHSKTATVHEEALMAISAVAARCGENFDKYMSTFKPFLMIGLQNAQEHHVCIVSVGCVSEISRALERKIQPYCDEIMQALLSNLQNPNMDRTVKPHIITCLADIALAAEGYFDRYLPYVMMMLVQASQIKFDNNDYDNMEYLAQLQESILEAYTAIIQGLSKDNKEGLFLQFVDPVLQFLGIIAMDNQRAESLLKAAVGVIGDLASRLGEKVKQHLMSPQVKVLMTAALESKSEDIQESAQWTKREIEKLR